MVASLQFIGVRTIGEKAHPILQGSKFAITLSTHRGEQELWGSVMGQSLVPEPLTFTHKS